MKKVCKHKTKYVEKQKKLNDLLTNAESLLEYYQKGLKQNKGKPFEIRTKYYSNISANRGQIKKLKYDLSFYSKINQKHDMFKQFVKYVAPMLDDNLTSQINKKFIVKNCTDDNDYSTEEKL